MSIAGKAGKRKAITQKGSQHEMMARGNRKSRGGNLFPNSALIYYSAFFTKSKIKTKKMVADFYANQNSIRIFCNSLIVKDSHKDTGIQLKNTVLKQAKMVSIYQKIISGTPQREPQQTISPIAKIRPVILSFTKIIEFWNL